MTLGKANCDTLQEREFQNMFTFSSGFEAATLKIPNKDSTAYGANAPSTANPINQQARGAFQLGYSFNGANDPYNLLTVNQGGVVVDSGKFDWTKSGRFPGFTEPSEGYHGKLTRNLPRGGVV